MPPFPGGLLAGVFPPVRDDGTACPHLPQNFSSAPRQQLRQPIIRIPAASPCMRPITKRLPFASPTPIAASNGQSNGSGDPVVHPEHPGQGVLFIDQDLIIGAPLWHDLGEDHRLPMERRWHRIAGVEHRRQRPSPTNNGQPGDSATGAHHILSIAESMKRGFSPAFILTQASAPLRAPRSEMNTRW